MTELDFEELDKAVNDLMQEGDSVPPPAGNDQKPVSVAAAPAQGTDDQQTQETPTPAAAPLAVKRRGRFMDMIAAPAGAKTQLADNAPKRVGITIAEPDAKTDEPEQNVPSDTEQQPVSDDSAMVETILSAPEQENNTDEYPNHADETEIADETLQEQTDTSDYAANPSPVHEWPEAQEVTDVTNESEANDDRDDQTASNSDDAVVPADEPAEPAGEEAESQDGTDEGEADKPAEPGNTDDQLTTVVAPDEPEAAPEQQNNTAPTLPESVMTSPFLPDAKVEKRPLGGEQAADMEADQAVAAAPEIPPEYSAELMNLGSDTDAADNTPSEPAAKPDELAAQAAALPAQAVPVAAATATGAIYDTDAYHAPIKPAKTKNGWLTVIWILVLLIVGSLAGAAYFYFTMQP